MTLATLLLPELEAELGKTRKMIDHLPEGHLSFKPHEKSFTLARLAGHTAELPNFISMILTTPSLELTQSGLTPLHYESKPQLLTQFNGLADHAIATLKSTSDEAFNEPWKLTLRGAPLIDSSRYEAYRALGINHMVHHRAQLGVYLRLLNSPVPATFGPSADEPFTPPAAKTQA